MNAPDDSPALKPKDALDLVVGFCIVLKVAKFYEPNNASFADQIGLFRSALANIFGQVDEVHLQASPSAIFVNHLRVKFDFSTYYIYKTLLHEMQAKGVGVITFRRGAEAEEAGRFMVLFSRLDPKKESPFERLEAALKAANLAHIFVEQDYLRSRPGEKETRAARLYFLGVTHARGLFERHRDIVKFNVTTRWIQAIFDHIVEDESFIYGLTSIKNYDEYTLNHSVNVALLSLSLGRRLGLSRSELSELGVSAFLHDLGKLDIPRDILDKPGPLDRNEWSVMEGHAQLWAERVIELTIQRGFPNRAVQVALEHHLKPDLDGYPRYERKKRVGLYSKVVKIADYFDALTTKRNYRPRAFTPEEALAIMVEKGEREFDPLLLKTFASMIGVHPVGSLVALDTGEVGIIFGLSVLPGLADRPKVKLIADPGGRKIDGPEVDLTDVDPATRTYRRSIVKVLDPEKYGVTVSDYFLARTSPA